MNYIQFLQFIYEFLEFISKLWITLNTKLVLEKAVFTFYCFLSVAISAGKS